VKAVNSEGTVSEPENTGRKQAVTLFKPGQSGNPKGRPKGSRNKINEAFLRDFYEAWEAMGRPAGVAAAWTDPVAFVRVAAGLLPKELEATVRNLTAKDLADDELASIALGSGEGAADETVDPSQLN
jgi:hypothetical protein